METRSGSAASQHVVQLFATRGPHHDHDGRAGDVEDAAALLEEVRQLREALSSRAAIDQAKGMLMAHYGIPAEHAFAVLVGWSQNRNVKVRDLAASMVADAEGGELALELPEALETVGESGAARNSHAGVR